MRGGEDCKMVENPNGMSLLERLCALRGGGRELFPPRGAEKGDDGGGCCSRECELTSRSSIDTSAEAWSEIEVEESRKGEGLRGGRESREKNDDGWERDRVWVGVGEPIWCASVVRDTGI